jgi:hypothetical protein
MFKGLQEALKIKTSALILSLLCISAFAREAKLT